MNVELAAASFAVGVTLGLLPGPVQFVLLTESSRGGVRRGFAAMAGANGTFGLLLLCFAAGAALLAPDAAVLRILRVAGGAFLLLLAGDAIVSSIRGAGSGARSVAGHLPLLRGVLAVLLNPGVWVFLATTASSLFASAAHSGGRPFALAVAVVMLGGIACVDGPIVLLGGGVRRFEQRLARWLTPALGVGLGAFGALLMAQGVD